MENLMLNLSIMKPEGILRLEPGAPLSKEDFNGLSAEVDATWPNTPGCTA